RCTMHQNMHTLVVCFILVHCIAGVCSRSSSSSSSVDGRVLNPLAKYDYERKTYTGWQVVRVIAPSQNSLRKQLMPNLKKETDIKVLNVLPNNGGGYSVDLLVKPNVSTTTILPEEFQADLTGQRNDLNFPGWTRLLDNLGQAIERQAVDNEKEEFGWKGFYRYNMIQDFLKSLAQNYSSVNLVNIGSSLNNRTIDAVIISDSPKKVLRKFNKLFRKDKTEKRRNER
ncbi:unnamed protein product, partial [Meganyctiphanes norvegica]